MTYLTDYLIESGIVNPKLDYQIHKELIRKYYRVLPALNRLEGRTLGFSTSVSTVFSTSPFDSFSLTDFNRNFAQLTVTAFYNNETYLNKYFQLNKSASIATIWLENYSRVYGISEEVSVDLSYFPDIDMKYSVGVGLYNRFHTIDELLNYGMELKSGVQKIFTQRLVIDFSVKARLSVNNRSLGFAEMNIRF